MIRFYTNRELSRALNINIARWKRWSREFLPPDPLGGLQSGYARQYTRNDAFTVFVGGYLVKDLNFTIPEARQILSDLKEPLFETGILESYDRVAKLQSEAVALIKHYLIFITSDPDASLGTSKLHYSVRGILAEETLDILNEPVRQIRYLEIVPSGHDADGKIKGADIRPVKVLPISALFDHFMATLGESGNLSSKNS